MDGKGSGPLWDEGSSSFVFHLPQISQTSFRNKKKLVSDLEGKKKVPSGEWLDRLPLSKCPVSPESHLVQLPQPLIHPASPGGMFTACVCIHSLIHSFICLLAHWLGLAPRQGTVRAEGGRAGGPRGHCEECRAPGWSSGQPWAGEAAYATPWWGTSPGPT